MRRPCVQTLFSEAVQYWKTLHHGITYKSYSFEKECEFNT